jgi:hypothetical protein
MTVFPKTNDDEEEGDENGDVTGSTTNASVWGDKKATKRHDMARSNLIPASWCCIGRVVMIQIQYEEGWLIVCVCVESMNNGDGFVLVCRRRDDDDVCMRV